MRAKDSSVRAEKVSREKTAKRSTCVFLIPVRTAQHVQKELEEDTNVLVPLATKG